MAQARTKQRRAPGAELSALMGKYGLKTNAGAQIAARILYMEPLTIQRLYSRDILRTELELLEIRLAELKRRGKL